jgi:hypothetical protein
VSRDGNDGRAAGWWVVAVEDDGLETDEAAALAGVAAAAATFLESSRSSPPLLIGSNTLHLSVQSQDNSVSQFVLYASLTVEITCMSVRCVGRGVVLNTTLYCTLRT